MARIVPVWPVRVCTISLDFGYTSHILIVLSAEPVIKKLWLNILSNKMFFISPLWLFGKLKCLFSCSLFYVNFFIFIDTYFLAVLLLCKLNDCAIAQTAKKWFTLFTWRELYCSYFCFLRSFAWLFAAWRRRNCFLFYTAWWKSKWLEFYELHTFLKII